MTTDNVNNLKSEMFISTTRTRVEISRENIKTHHNVRLLRVDAIFVRLKRDVNVSKNPYCRGNSLVVLQMRTVPFSAQCPIPRVSHSTSIKRNAASFPLGISSKIIIIIVIIVTESTTKAFLNYGNLYGCPRSSRKQP